MVLVRLFGVLVGLIDVVGLLWCIIMLVQQVAYINFETVKISTILQYMYICIHLPTQLAISK